MSEATPHEAQEHAAVWTRAEIDAELRRLLECETCEAFTALQREHIAYLIRCYGLG